MVILCDTCSTLMLIRIAPDMFTDPAFECCTVAEVRSEIYQTQKFKSKYQWRDKYKNKIQHIPFTPDQTRRLSDYLSTINTLLDNHTINNCTGRIFNLSGIDRKIVAAALACGHKISSTDNPLMDFAEQEFPDDFQGNILPLGLVNLWLNKKLLKWGDELEKILIDWKTLDEPPQTRDDKKTYYRITRKEYPGP